MDPVWPWNFNVMLGKLGDIHISSFEKEVILEKFLNHTTLLTAYFKSESKIILAK